ncbi:MAG: hypothetical protein ACYT04_75590 [Nostoc sp.]
MNGNAIFLVASHPIVTTRRISSLQDAGRAWKPTDKGFLAEVDTYEQCALPQYGTNLFTIKVRINQSLKRPILVEPYLDKKTGTGKMLIPQEKR